MTDQPSHLTDAHLTDAHLTDAHLTDAHLTDAHLTDAHLTDAHLTDAFVPNTDELLLHNARFVEQFDEGHLDLAPKRQLAIVACMDSRMDIFAMLGLRHGDAHIIRNAGGVVTDDVIRSLVLSQRRLRTREIVLIHHTNCGLEGVSVDEFARELEAECGMRPWWALEAFADPYDDVRQSMVRLHLSPFVLHKDHIRGFVYDVADGRLHEVFPRPPA